MKNVSLLFDRSFSLSYKKQVLWLLGLIVVTTCVLLLIGLIPGMYDHSSTSGESRGYVIDTIYLLMDPGNAADPMSVPYLLIVALSGIIVFCGLFISVVTNILNRRVELFETGQLHYHLKDHVVVIGYDNTTPALVHALCNELAGNYILLQVPGDVPSVRDDLALRLTEDEMERVVLYAGRQNLEEDLRRLDLNKCKRLYIVGNVGQTSRDALNMDTLRHVAEIYPAEREQLTCYVQFVDLDAYHLLQFSELDEKVGMRLHVMPYNFANIWAQRLLIYSNAGEGDSFVQYRPIDSAEGISATSDKHVHLVVFGMNDMGVAIAEQAAQIAHYPNYDEAHPENATIITFVDTDMEAKQLHFRNKHAGLFEIENEPWLDVRWRFMEGTTEDSSVREFLQSLATDQQCVLTLAFCEENSEACLSQATHLPHSIYESSNLQIWVRQDDNAALATILTANPSSRFASLKSFGQIDAFFTKDLVPEAFGKMVNACYDGIDLSNQSGIDKDWHLEKGKPRPVTKKWSSMHSANMRFTRLRSLGLDVETVSLDDLNKAVEAHLEEMMAVEHNRWNMEKLLGGFRALVGDEIPLAMSDGDEKARLKNAPYFAHLDICSLVQLKVRDEETIDYDRKVLMALPKMIEVSRMA